MNIKSHAANLVFGRNFPAVGTCVCHGLPVTEADFRDDTSKREYLISRLCQQTQDTVFGSDDLDGEDY